MTCHRQTATKKSKISWGGGGGGGGGGMPPDPPRAMRSNSRQLAPPLRKSYLHPCNGCGLSQSGLNQIGGVYTQGKLGLKQIETGLELQV